MPPSLFPIFWLKALSLTLAHLPGDQPPPEPHQDLGPYAFPDLSQAPAIKDYLLDLKSKGESCGSALRVMIYLCPPGLGEPCFDKLKSDLSKAIMSIGGVVSFSYGNGEKMLTHLGSKISSQPSAFGGIEGGISNGDPLSLNIIFKPPSTVGKKAQQGRHDPCLLPRAIPVVESMVKLTLADHFLRQQAYGLPTHHP